MGVTTTDARLVELRSTRDTVHATRGALLDGAVLAGRGLTDAERAQHTDLSEQLSTIDVRIADLEDTARREAAAAAHLATTATPAAGGVPAQRATSSAQVTDAPIYAPRGATGHSYFRDLARAQVFGDREATDRLLRNTAQVNETRALGNTNTTPGSGQEFAPPQWLISEWIKLARAGRVTADLFTKHPVPMGVSSINIPKIGSGTAVATQTTQNTALAATDLTTTSVSTGFTTLGGTETVSQQLLDQSAIPLDDVIAADLAAEYGRAVGNAVLLGPGTGANNNSVINGLYNVTGVPASNVAVAQASITAGQFWSKCAGLQAAFTTNRFAPPTHWLMAPRRWYWLLAATDSQGRPLVVPDTSPVNAMATDASPGLAQGYVGTFQGLPVVIDPQHPLTVSATGLTGGTMDRVLLIKADDMMIFEAPPRSEAFQAPLATTVSVIFRLYSYLGTILNRYPASIAYLDQVPAPAF